MQSPITSSEVTADQRALNVVPALIADLGDEAAWRYVEFFTANIRNPHTRRAYGRACARFFAWCEDRGLVPAAIRPHDVATYIEQLQNEVSAPSVKQQLPAVRMLFDWLVIGQVVPTNPAAAARGPKHVVKTGKTPVLEGAEGTNCSSRSRTRHCAICATGAPDESGTRRREKGLARAGNARVRRGMIQLAWRFLLFQRDSALAQWYRARTEAARGSGPISLNVNLSDDEGFSRQGSLQVRVNPDKYTCEFGTSTMAKASSTSQIIFDAIHHQIDEITEEFVRETAEQFVLDLIAGKLSR